MPRKLLKVEVVHGNLHSEAARQISSMRPHSKSESNYHRPNANTFQSQDRICLTCSHFRAEEFSKRESGCELVRGIIEKEYVCDMWRLRP